MVKSAFLNLFFFWVFISSAMAQRKNLLFDGNLKNNLLTKFPEKEIFDKNALIISDSVLRKGQKSIRSEVRSSNLSDKGIRAEFAFKPEAYPERWYGLSIYAPANYLPDPEPESVVQWHNVPDSQLGESWLSPSLSLWVQDGKWNFHILWDTAKVTRQDHFMGQLFTDLGNVETNAWTDWVFHIKFSYKEDGLVEIYKNGVKVFTRNGPNNFNDVALPYWKVGLYKWVYKDHDDKIHRYNQRVLYYSQIRKGSKYATYKDVAPR
jgi:hypothetical protein